MRTRIALYAVAVLCALAFGGCCDSPLALFYDGCTHLRASLSANPSTVKPRSRVGLEGRALKKIGEGGFNPGDLDVVAWDYDGDGHADVIDDADNLTNVFHATTSYAAPGVVRPAFMVIGGEGPPQRATARTEVTVTAQPGENEPPVAVLSAPSEVNAHEDVTLDGSGSNDRDGSIFSYRWDFNDDGTIDAGPRTASRVTTRYDHPGTYQARLLVTDNDGATASATRTIRVLEAGPRGPGAVAVAAAAQRFSATLQGDLLGRAPRRVTRGGLTTWRGIRSAGRLRVWLPGRRLRGLLTMRWRTRLTLTFDTKTLAGRMSGLAVARPRRHARRGEWGCLRVAGVAPGFRPSRGTIRLLGGSGRYSKLRMRASFTPTVAGAAIRLKGVTHVTRGKQRDMPRRCRALLPKG